MEKKRIVLASDHAGLHLKNLLRERLTDAGYPVLDAGTDSPESCDYPIYAEKGCRALLDGYADLCILICGTGIGMSMAANKIRGIRAAAVSDVYSARYTRLHNDANVLCLGGRVVGAGLALELVDLFLTTPFEKDNERHVRRVAQIASMESGR
jgi:ribose 5-phosphate isomerase B